MTLLRLAVAAAALVVAGLGAVLTSGPAQAAPDTGCRTAEIETRHPAGDQSPVARCWR